MIHVFVRNKKMIHAPQKTLLPLFKAGSIEPTKIERIHTGDHCLIVLVVLTLFLTCLPLAIAFSHEGTGAGVVFSRVAFFLGCVLASLLIAFFKVDYSRKYIIGMEIWMTDRIDEYFTRACCLCACKFIVALPLVICGSVFVAFQVFQ
jgi:hypothetical protein